jgi:hypothetical protein
VANVEGVFSIPVPGQESINGDLSTFTPTIENQNVGVSLG